MNKKVLFLDHDGVICLPKQWGKRFDKMKAYNKNNSIIFGDEQNDIPVNIRFDDFDKKSVELLNMIILRTSCDVVVSSDWKYWATLEEMKTFYNHQGIMESLIDYTPLLKDCIPPSDFMWDSMYDLEQSRSIEIKTWISENHPKTWVAVDDMDLNADPNWGLDSFIRTNPNVGLTETISENIIKILNKYD